MEALMIEREECDTILNGKGINLVPRMKIEDNSEFQRIKHTETQKRRQEERGGNEGQEQDPFSNQLSQRKKRAKTQRQISEAREAQTNDQPGTEKAKTGAHTILNFYKKEIRQSRNSSQGADPQLNRGGICEGPKSDPRKAKLEPIEN